MRAVPFDLARLEIIGTHEQVLEGVMTSREGAANAAWAANGALIYVPGTMGGAGRRTVVLVDRQGRVSPLPGLPLDAYRDVRVSPDGARLALSSDNGVATYDVARAAVSALTTDTAREYRPLWTPDSARIVYSSNPGGYPELFWRPADGSASGQRLLTRGKDILDLLANGWAPDRQLLFTKVQGSVRCAIGQVAIAPASEGRLLLKNEVCNAHAALSPNGRWIAYRSRRGRGRDEICRTVPALRVRVDLSGGGTIPAWSRDGTELFFISLDAQQMYSVAVQTGMTLDPGRPQFLFQSAMAVPEGGARPYDVTPDGRFVVIQGDRTEVFRRQRLEHDPGAELVRGIEASGANQLMPLAIGTRVGPYEITGTLGAGGMGEVYRARDTKLNRDVALKILPTRFARDPDRLARFQREAQVLASLNHPNIARDLRARGRRTACTRSCSSSSRARRWPIASRAGRCRSTRRCRSRGRLPTRSRPPTSTASSIATSSRPTSRSARWRRSRSWTSAWRRRWTGQAGRRRRPAHSPTLTAGDDRRWA